MRAPHTDGAAPVRRPACGLAAWLGMALLAPAAPVLADDSANLEELVAAVEPRVIAWRRDIHRNPELGNREVRTAGLVAAHLRSLGLDVRTGIAHTGVTALLEGGRPGPTVALRADMDALPVTERTDVPFRSQVTTTYRGQPVGVMHACGHDAHTAVLMGVAEVLSRVRERLAGDVLFIFQPAEEGVPDGEEGGAELMLKEGLFERQRPRAIFGLHVSSLLRVGEIGYRSGPIMAAADTFRIVVWGRQSHGSLPWQGIDPIVTAAQIVNALQTVVSRRTDLTAHPAVVTVGAIHGGVRSNIIPDSVEMLGTVRTFSAEQRAGIVDHMRQIVERTAAANGAGAEFTLGERGEPVTVNDPELTARMLPTLQRVVGADRVRIVNALTGSEDFAYYAQRTPGLYFFVGVTPADQDPATAPPNHSDYFYLDERGLTVAVRSLVHLTMDFLEGSGWPGDRAASGPESADRR